MKKIKGFTLVMVLLFTSCKTQENTQNQTNNKAMESFDKIVYLFREASLPPQYYRNYTITLTQSSGNIKIYDYANELLKKEFGVSEKKWAELQAIAKDLKGESVTIAKGATGTKTYAIELYDGDKKTYSCVWDSMSEVGEVNTNIQKLLMAGIGIDVQAMVEKTIKN